MFRFAMMLFMLLPLVTQAVEIVYLGPLDEWPEIDFSTTAAGIVGRTGQPGHLLDPEESYFAGGVAVHLATTFDPMASDLPCGVGIQVRAIHVVVAKLGEPSHLLYFQSPSFGDAYLRSMFPPDQECFQPTNPRNTGYDTYCHGGPRIDVLEGETGFYELIYTDFEPACGCIDMAYTQSLCIDPLFDSESVWLVTDIAPGHCPDHGLYPTMGLWAVWYEFEAPGNLVIWAEVDCCETPVATETMSWSSIKGLFR